MDVVVNPVPAGLKAKARLMQGRLDSHKQVIVCEFGWILLRKTSPKSLIYLVTTHIEKFWSHHAIHQTSPIRYASGHKV
jgi:hypothetical protein